MRAMLANEKNRKIALEEELDLINSYIDLQKIRLNEDTQLDYKVEGNFRLLSIEPLILINFIENVFKHGLSDEQSVIRIHIKIENDKLILITENKIATGKKDDVSGIGLANVKKRLDIVYPGAYKLAITAQEKMYKVELEINLAWIK
jgi:LytS/YehU family sensor histidine kinase